MSAQQQDAFSDVITFDIFDDSDIENNQITIRHLTQEEQDDIANVVSLMDSVNSKELMDFSSQDNAVQHKPVNPVELDHLAGKNNAITNKLPNQMGFNST